MTHTSTPWIVEQGIGIINKNGFEIAQATNVDRIKSESNAAFIVKAVNCHEDLLEACKEVAYWLKGSANPDLKEVAIRKMEKAIAKAGGFKA